MNLRTIIIFALLARFGRQVLLDHDRYSPSMIVTQGQVTRFACRGNMAQCRAAIDAPAPQP